MRMITTEPDQLLSIIPTRESDEDNNTIFMNFTDETTKEVYDVESITKLSYNDYLLIGSDAFDFFKENTFYNLKVYFENTNEVIYKDRLFCTNQPKETYSINNGEYTLPNIDNNDYITI